MAQGSNPQNIPGAQIGTLVGWVGGVDYPPFDKQGTRGYKQVSIPVNEGYKKDGQFVQTGTTWYRWEQHQDKIAELGVQKGDKVRLDDAKQEVREYGEGKLGITLTYGTLTILEKGNSAPAAPAQDGDFF